MAIVLFSGGQDSTTALLWAVRHLPGPWQALSFAYGQRHAVELTAAQTIIQRLALSGLSHTILSIGELWQNLAVPSALTQALPIEQGPSGLPSTFVPGRNLIFLTLAAIWGYARQDYTLVIGASQVDYSGYPDCREGFLQAAEKTLQEALEQPIRIIAPFLYWDKAQLWRYADELGYKEFIAEHTHTCYLGDRTKRHPWGYGCGSCPACLLRRKGYEQAFANFVS
ncbi:MAG: 7-cyano-7-deazaguanine synthase QueC [Bacteroidia bacterium]